MPSPNKTWSNLHACQFLFTQPQNHTVLTIGSNWSRGNPHKATSDGRQALGPHWRLPTPVWHTCVISVSACPLTFPWTIFPSVSLLVSFVFIIEIGCGYLLIQEAFLAAWSLSHQHHLLDHLLHFMKVACCFYIAFQVHEGKDHLSDSLPSITLGNTSQGLSNNCWKEKEGMDDRWVIGEQLVNSALFFSFGSPEYYLVPWMS